MEVSAENWSYRILDLIYGTAYFDWILRTNLLKVLFNIEEIRAVEPELCRIVTVV